MTHNSGAKKNLTAALINQIKHFDLDLEHEIFDNLIDYILLLNKWNKTYNLTAIREPEKMLTHHLLDSLSVTKYIKGKHVLDVGTGAGLPGIPLALVLPQFKFTLLDSVGKKIHFLNNVLMHLKIENVKIVQARIENFQDSKCFDTIITRATFSLTDIIEKTRHLLCENGQWLLMKGKYPQTEIDDFYKLHPEAKETFKIIVHKLEVPDLNAERHLVCISRHK